ncbi:MAG: zinc ribbon domain-containing protein [Thermoanaerobacteraceae bacterium]|nr:zinc ribbon domain-containing protein [Thermoanaerobacteraceae bacterium]
MPNYDFKCKDCGELFTKRVSWQDKDKVRCPKCNGETEQRFTGFGLLKGGAAGGGSSCGPAGSPFG